MFFKATLLLAIAGLSIDVSNGATDKVFCYHGSWSYYRTGNGRFTVNDVDTSLCTHFVYSFVGLNTDGSIRILDEWLEVNLGNLANTNALKSSNPNLKTLVAIGGWNEGSVGFSAVAASKELRTNLINSAISLLEQYGFDGFDLDWEYPAQRGGAAADKANFAILLEEFRAAFDKKNLILTAAVSATGNSVDISYDVPALSKNLDLINVMTYDFHGSFDAVIGHNSPLYASSIDVTAAQKQLNVDASIKGWIARGAAPAKLALGLAAYGRTFTLSNANSNQLGAPISNSGVPGPYTQEGGMLGYNEIVEKLAAGGWTQVWDDEQKVPHAYNGDQWVGFDNPRSIALKVNYAKEMGLGGVMLWSIENEDFRGVSGSKYPLLNAVKAALGGSADENTDDSNNTGSNDNSNNESDTDSNNNNDSINNDSGSNNNDSESNNNDSDSNNNDSDSNKGNTNTNECTKNGYLRDSVNCNQFHLCVAVGNVFIKYSQLCPSGLVFNIQHSYCDWPANVVC